MELNKKTRAYNIVSRVSLCYEPYKIRVFAVDTESDIRYDARGDEF